MNLKGGLPIVQYQHRMEERKLLDSLGREGVIPPLPTPGQSANFRQTAPEIHESPGFAENRREPEPGWNRDRAR